MSLRHHWQHRKQNLLSFRTKQHTAKVLHLRHDRKGLELNKAMGVNFEKERVVLGGMRDKIRALLDKKTAKLNKLLAQIERIKAAMGDDDYDAAKKSLTEHLKIVGKSCRGMAAFASGLKVHPFLKTNSLIGAMENKGDLPKTEKTEEHQYNRPKYHENGVQISPHAEACVDSV